MKLYSPSHIILGLVFLLSTGCMAGRGVRESISSSDIDMALRDEGVVDVLNKERHDEDGVTYLIAVYNVRSFGNWCRADRIDLSMRKEANAAVIDSVDKSGLISFYDCNSIERRGIGFAPINSKIDSGLLRLAMSDLTKIVRGENQDPRIISNRTDLKSIFFGNIEKNLASVSLHAPDIVYFQFDDRKIFPAKLGVEMKYLNGKLTEVSLDDMNSYEIIPAH